MIKNADGSWPDVFDAVDPNKIGELTEDELELISGGTVCTCQYPQ